MLISFAIIADISIALLAIIKCPPFLTRCCGLKFMMGNTLSFSPWIRIKFSGAFFLFQFTISLMAHLENSGFEAAKISCTRFLSPIAETPINQLIIIFPFYQTHDLSLVKNVIKNSFGKYPFVSYGAFNFWFLVGDFNVYTATVTHDSKLIWGISMNRWGFLLFCFSSFFALFHLAKNYFLLIFKKVKLNFSLEKTLVSASLIPLIFFFFNTQMHERYSHPAFIFLVSYAILYRKFIPYITGSLAHFLSLEYIHRHYNLGVYDYFFFKTTFIACLYLFTIAYLFFQLFEGECFIRNIFVKKSLEESLPS